ncbi:MAG TPA: hypothetical protein VMM76_17295 [Pirellulaceae bacterium]|nr:hypothetical protein [Pirellulaceae bacterium]
MKQIFSIAIAAVLATSVLLPPASAQQRNDRTDDAIVQRLDEILKRLETIETRLKKLEVEVRVANQWSVDERGVMRTIDGRPMGFWGIDGLPTTTIR